MKCGGLLTTVANEGAWTGRGRTGSVFRMESIKLSCAVTTRHVFLHSSCCAASLAAGSLVMIRSSAAMPSVSSLANATSFACGK
jgi:hypothetical protein